MMDKNFLFETLRGLFFIVVCTGLFRPWPRLVPLAVDAATGDEHILFSFGKDRVF